MNMQLEFHPSNHRGVTLVELLVSIVIGVILVFGAVQVYVDSKRTYDVNESVARLQETARYAMSVIEPDVRQAGFFGLLKGADFIAVSDAVEAALPSTCGATFLFPGGVDDEDPPNIQRVSVEGSNASYPLACAAYTGGAVTTADGITIRRSAVSEASETSGRLFTCASRIAGQLVTSTADADCPPASVSTRHNYIVNHYYVARQSVQSAALTALRRRELTANSGSPALQDVEIIPGIEDMQIQFGISNGATSGEATHYVEPDAVTGQIVAVRIWLLVRSETTEVGFTDGRTYLYGSRTDADGTTDDLSDADAATAGYAPNDGFRRLLVSRTIQLRNAMGT